MSKDRNPYKPFLLLFIFAFVLIALVLGVSFPIVFLILFCSFCYLFAYRINIKHFCVFLFAFALIIRIGYLLIIDTPIISDYRTLFVQGAKFAHGDYSFNKSLYFRDWAYLTSSVIYNGIIIKIFGEANAILVLKILNAFFGAGTCLMIYLILKNFMEEKLSRIASLFCAGMVFPLTFVTVLSNQHQSTFFFISGLFILTDKKRKWNKWVKTGLSGACLAVGNIMRPEGIVIIISLSLFLLLRLIKPEGEKRHHMAARAIVLVMVYYLINGAAAQLIIRSGVNPHGLANNNVLWKFVEGLNYDTMGTYSPYDSTLVYDHSLTPEEREELEISIIKERLGIGPAKLMNLFINKQKMLWAGNATIVSYRHLLEAGEPINAGFLKISIKDIDNMLSNYHALQMFFLICLSIMGAISGIKNTKNAEMTIFYISLLLSAGIYLFIEVQPRYIHLQLFMLVITAAAGLDALTKNHRKVCHSKEQL